MKPVVLFSDPVFLRHQTGRHPERPERLIRILARLEQHGLVAPCRRGEFTPATPEQIARIHDPNVAIHAERVAAEGGGLLDADTIVSPESYDVARAAVGASMAAVDEVVQGPDRRALCLTRPPGHHATPSQSMGFCFFNNVALAAQRARDQHGLSRILVVDWDVHHGNGTQDIFFEQAGVGFVSVHRFGHGFYPGTGDRNETGSGAGLGWIRNTPLPATTSRAQYLAAFRDAVEAMADQVKPELVLVSAGFDAHVADPIGGLGLEADDFIEMSRILIDIADTHAHGRLVSLLEGGYNIEVLAECVSAHLEELLSYRTQNGH